MQDDFLTRWLITINGAAELYVTALFAFGLLCVAIVGMRFKDASQMGSMKTKPTPPISNTIAVMFVAAGAMYLGSLVASLDETIFYGIQGSRMGDPLSWRLDDTVPSFGGREDMIRELLIKIIQFFGLVGVGNGLSHLFKFNSDKGGQDEGHLKKMLYYFVAGVALLRPDKTTTLFAELIPGFSGIANFFSN